MKRNFQLALTMLALALSVPACAGRLPARSDGGSTRAVVPRHQPGFWEAPTVVERRLDNGIRILMVERRDLPLVYVRFLIKRGAADAAPGAASYAASILQQQLWQGKGRVWVRDDAVGIDLMSLTRDSWLGSNLPDEAFGTTCRLLMRPQLTPQVMEQEKARLLALAKREANADRARMLRFEHETLYPPEHPYRNLALADERATSQLDFAALQQFFHDQVQPDQVVVIAAGDVATESFLDSVRNGFQRWQGRAVPRRRLPEPIPDPIAGATITLIDRPGRTESQLLLAARGTSWQSSDYEPLVILNAVLGGSFTSRLNLNLREQNSYGYGASSTIAFSRGVGLIEAHCSVAAEHTADAMREMSIEIARLRSGPLDERELARFKMPRLPKFL